MGDLMIPIEDPNELREVCDLIKQIASGVRCDVDKKKRRIAISPSTGTLMLMLNKRIGPSMLGATQFQEVLEQIVQTLEREHRIRLIFDGASTLAAILGAPVHYYKVYKL